MNFEYRQVDAKALTLEVDLPEGEGPFPLIIYVHSWSGTSDQLKQHSMAMAGRLGIAGVRINYRKFSEGTTFEEAASDMRAALAFVRHNQKRFGFDLQRLGIAGASAGALLSSWMAQQVPESRFFIGFNGAYDLVDTGESRFLRDKTLKGIIGDLSEASRRKASAIHQLKDPPPATLLLHGTDDVVIDSGQAVRFAERIRASGGKAEVSLYPRKGHGFFNSGEESFPRVVQDMETFLREVLPLKDGMSR